ncbi:MAG: endopeptidase La [Spirochaetaceae bacterium]|nr:MAG: endopeptidase La [Spirochaetaceae bacterium]
MDTDNLRNIVPADHIIPTRLVVIPVTGRPLYPGIFIPMMVTGERDLKAVQEASASDGFVGLVLTRDEDIDDPTAEDLFEIGTAARIVKKINLPDGGLNIFLQTVKRFRVKKVLKSSSPIVVAAEQLEDTNYQGDEVKALTRSLIGEMKQVSENNPLFSEEMRLNMVNIDHPGKIADFIASILNLDRDAQQNVLETMDVRTRMEMVLVHIKQEQELMRIQKRIQTQINEKIEKSQREYFLKEQLKAIKEELGMSGDAKSSELKRLRDAIESVDLPDDVRESVEQELEKFALTEPQSPEFAIIRNYLDTVIGLPWGEPAPDDIDINRASEILEKDHYGLDDVKERILEFLSVRILRKDTKGSIICLVGPPGVGKTSIGRSIARALGKEFFRFSVGGMRDEAEIKGHRRTYVGAMPGKIIQGLKIVKDRAPVFMIDEIDKLGSGIQGDPSSALLEVLDPEQNSDFRDHYLDLPFDVSGILFVTTANNMDTIPGPLLDRMEVIRISGYINEEKTAIARKYLIPKSLTKAGLKRSEVKYNKTTLIAIADRYAREAGVRNYEKALDRIHRKIARAKLEGKVETPVKMSPELLPQYLGHPSFEELNERTVERPGMAIGLAWTPYGGDTLLIEAAQLPGKEAFKLTGKMGEVMQESANIAYTYVRSIASEYGVSADFFETHSIHLHIPAGAIPKDGPSAGITMATTLLSLARGKAIRKNVAMTGELSLLGAVLPIGGLKEKTVAAKRSRIKTILFPKANEKDLEDIPQHVKKGIRFVPVSRMEEVIAEVF